jgi:hypothetical protein
MGIAILLVCFISFFVLLGTLFGNNAGKKEVLLATVLSFSAVVVLITEGLSLWHQLTYTNILFLWIAFAMINLSYLYFKLYQSAVLFCTDFKNQLGNAIRDLSGYEWFLLTATVIILVLVFIQGVVYPPNNWDAMTYHLGRIPSWISHQSVAHYYTQIFRQIYQPPFAEYMMMQFNILSGNDRFSGLVQLFFLLATLAALLVIVKAFGFSRKYQLLTIALSISIPEVALQASSTQNDIVVSFFIITTCVFAYKTVRLPVLSNFVFLGLATGLGILTKGTAYLCFAPILLIFGITMLVKLYQTRNVRLISYAIAFIGIGIAINAGHYYRNYKTSHNVLGADKKEVQTYANQKMSPVLLMSNIIKNAGMHFDMIYADHFAEAANSVIYKLHQIAGVDINDPAINYRGMKYSTEVDSNSEDSAPNLIHLLLIVTSAFIFIFSYSKTKHNNNIALLLFAVAVLQIMFFGYYLKWQPWNSRLQVPIFLLFVPFIVYILSISNWYKKVVSYVILPLLLFTGCMNILHNNNRPFNNLMLNNRYKNYFVSRPALYEEYKHVVKDISASHNKNIGLEFGVDDWVYPLFTDCYKQQINPIYINVNNITANTIIDTNPVDCIVSTTQNKLFIDYKGKRFYNQSNTNKGIWFYK